MNGGDFFDSNIFVYLFDESAPHKQARAKELVGSAIRNRRGAISYQVVQETLSVITTKLQPTATPEEARVFLADSLIPLWSVMPSTQLYEHAIDVQGRYGYHFYDALIIAAALQAGCTRLLSEDLHDGQRIESLAIVNPFEI